ncbi:MAG: hypothetical protein Q8R91_04725 [Candidatus Omnitrophota bacterium]|nr:hypothetical protein [Candidatus Omnitrophota bacterium]
MCGWVRERGGDLPYWYAKEETNIGFLAAAAWRLGGVALQEFTVTRPEAKGQGDLWIKLGEMGCHIEAKGTDSPSTSRDAVEQALSKAKNQLILPPNEKANMGMAACFVVPAITDSAFDFRELVTQFEGGDSIVAVYLPDRTLDLQYEEHNYPGVALIGQVVWPK